MRWAYMHSRIVGLFLSMTFASYKAYENRMLYIASVDRSVMLEDRLDEEREQTEFTKNTLKTVLFNIATANFDFDIIPMPFWYKVYDKENDQFKMVYVNRAYENHYDIERIKYLSNLDKDVHGTERANEYEKFDRKAFSSRTAVFAIEPDILGGKAEVIKWRVDRGGDIFIYGMITKYIKE